MLVVYYVKQCSSWCAFGHRYTWYTFFDGCTFCKGNAKLYPILAPFGFFYILRIFILFGVLFAGLNSVVVYQNSQISGMLLVFIILYVILLDSHTRVSRSSGARAQIRLSPSESGGRRRSELPKMQNALPATLQGNMKTGSLAHLLVEELPRASWLGTPTNIHLTVGYLIWSFLYPVLLGWESRPELSYLGNLRVWWSPSIHQWAVALPPVVNVSYLNPCGWWTKI